MSCLLSFFLVLQGTPPASPHTIKGGCGSRAGRAPRAGGRRRHQNTLLAATYYAVVRCRDAEFFSNNGISYHKNEKYINKE